LESKGNLAQSLVNTASINVILDHAGKKRLSGKAVYPGTLVNFTAMKQVITKGISLANKCMIMAAVAYNLKKLIKGISTRVRKRVPKATNSDGSFLNKGLMVYNIALVVIKRYFRTSNKSKWLNNHLLCKLNYSAI
jgi:hypothetical protein